MIHDKKYRRKGDYVIREVEGETLVIPINNDAVELDSAYVLSSSGAFIFNLLDEAHAFSAIVDKVTAEFNVSNSEAEADVKLFISEIEDVFLE